MKKRSDTALRILQLLLRCGMVCQEELDVVLEMMTAAQANKQAVPMTAEVSGERARQNTLVFESD